jgi:hypothetical protein
MTKVMLAVYGYYDQKLFLDGPVMLCGPAQEVWELIREKNQWYKEDEGFSITSPTFNLLKMHGAIHLYEEED